MIWDAFLGTWTCVLCHQQYLEAKAWHRVALTSHMFLGGMLLSFSSSFSKFSSLIPLRRCEGKDLETERRIYTLLRTMQNVEWRTAVMNGDFLLSKKQENLPLCLVVILAMSKGVLVPPRPKVWSPKSSFDIICFASGSTGIMELITGTVWVPLPLPGPAGLETPNWLIRLYLQNLWPPWSMEVEKAGEGQRKSCNAPQQWSEHASEQSMLHNAGSEWNRNPPLWKWAAASKVSVFGRDFPRDVFLQLLMCD